MFKPSASTGSRSPEISLPPQARGRRRRAEIVDATIALIDEFGVHSDAVSMKAIAARAGTSAATIYHYFEDSEALFTAVARQFMEGLLRAESFRDDELERTDLLIGRTVEAERRYMAKHPGLRDLWFDRRASDGVIEVHVYYRELTAERMRKTIGLLVDDPGSALQYTMLLEQVGALWDLAFSLDPEGNPEVVAEIRALETHFIEARAGRKRGSERDSATDEPSI